MEPKLIRKHQKYVEYVGKKNKPKPKTFFNYKNNGLFNIPDGLTLLVMSDIHSITPDIVSDLIKKKIINENTIVFSCGDMAGGGDIGGDGDPYETYVKIKNNSHSFYFVQGNHDISNKSCEALQNNDGTYCMVGKRLQKTPIGTITGVNGIYVNEKQVNPKRHKMTKETYMKRVRNALRLKPDIFLTHQPLNKDEIMDNLPKYHLCGHMYQEDYFCCDGDYVFINLDNKIMHFHD